MRGVRIAAFVVTGLLACLVISHIFSVDPDSSQDDNANLSSQPETKPVVPEPPDPQGTPVAEPEKKHSTPTKIATSKAPARPSKQMAASRLAVSQPVFDTPADVRPIIRDAETGQEIGGHRSDAAASSSSDASPEIASSEEPKGPVIVVPHERPKQDNRGVRWMKAVGHALGIGATPTPESQAFH